MDHLTRLGKSIAEVRYEDLPADAVRAARLQILNMIAAAHGAVRYPDVAATAGAVAGFAGAGRATILATGHKVGPADAALANAACSMAQDFDDIVWMGHTCHSAVFAALAVAEHEGKSARDLVTAVVVSNEIAGRLGATCFLGPLNGQMWTFIHLFGGAAAAAKLLGLDAARAAHALAISVAQPNFALQPGFMAPTSKLLAASTPTSTGIQAAYFARAGMTGATDILEDPRGFWHRFAFIPLPFMLDGLGSLWVTQTLTVKNYPGCHFFQTACAAIDEIQGRTGRLDPAKVKRVRVDTTKLGREVTTFGSAYAPSSGVVTQVNVNFNLATTAAIHVLAGRLTGDEMDPRWLAANSDAIRALVAKTRVVHDPELTAKVMVGARAIGEGRKALSGLGPRDLVTLVRRYRAEYRSSLVTPAELAGWIKLIGKRAMGRGAAKEAPVTGSTVPLYFPNRVTIELEGGRRETAQVDLPPGSFAAPGMERVLEEKFLRETQAMLGPAGARAAWSAGLALEGQTVPGFVAKVVRS